MTDDIQKALDAGAATGNAKKAGGDYAVVPEGYRLEDLEVYGAKPRRARGEFRAEDMPSFCAYVNRFKGSGTIIAASVEQASMTGLLDHHESVTAPGFGEHKATYNPPLSEEWKRWSGADGKAMNQAEFATFIEENASDIVEPDSAAVIELARSLKATRKVDFLSDIDLSDGTVQFRYEETTEAHGSKRTDISVPKFLMLGIPVFFGGTPYKVRAFFRYRVDDQKRLSLFVNLHRKRFIHQDAFLDLVAEVKKATEIDPLLGAL